MSMIDGTGMLGENIELSVIVPVYNAELYIERCLRSILNQTYCVGEIICVDDGSKDNSLEILERYSKIDARIKIISKENGGVVSARKAGIACAKGKYATYVDSDDWIESNMYEEMMEIMKRSEADIVTSGCIRDYGNHYMVEKENIASGVYDGENMRQNLLSKMISTGTFFQSNISIHIYNKIFERNLLKKYQLRVDDYVNVGDDAACVYPCLLAAKRIAVTGNSYYHYCMRSNSIMGTQNDDEGDRYEVLFAGLNEECYQFIDKVPNIGKQLKFLEYYVRLLKQARWFITIKQGVLFPFGQISQTDKVVIYGAGRFGHELKVLLEEKRFCNIVAWVDKTPREGVLSLDSLNGIDYDKIIIAVLISDVAEQIKNELLIRNIDEEKIYMVDYRLLCED